MAREVKPIELNKPDFFVAGLTGAGKDTIVNYLKDYFDYRKMRLAKTIKTIICEKNDLTFDELENLKRTNQEFRVKHHEESLYLTKESSLVRAKQIARRTSMDFECVSNPEKQVAVCDVRCADEAGILLEHDFIGLFLSRTTDEFKDSAHYTEQNLFHNGQLLGLIEDFPGNTFVIVLNSVEQETEFLEKLNKLILDQELENIIILTFEGNPTEEQLIEKIDEVVSDLIDKENE